MSLPAVIVFVRNPEAGKVKTRIAAEAGINKALEIYVELLFITRDVVTSFPSERYVFYTDRIEDSDEWRQPIFKKAVQQGTDLGERMHAAFRFVYKTNPANSRKKTLLIGSDCPEITTQILHEASAALDTMDCVIGPAVDGGYYLIGFSGMPDIGVFSDIHWSTSSVYVDTLQRLSALQYTYHELPLLNDVDTLEDWERFVRRVVV
jgi:rSAM/selenodomain-associated transferase 1